MTVKLRKIFRKLNTSTNSVILIKLQIIWSAALWKIISPTTVTSNRNFLNLIGDYSLSYSSVTRGAVHSTSWKFSTLWKFSQHIAYIFRKTRSFLSNFEILIKFSNISITSAYVQIAFTCDYILSAYVEIAFTCHYILFTGLLSWYEIETCIGGLLS